LVSYQGLAQMPGGGQPPGPPPSAQKAAPIDLTGNWVAVIAQDWRFRMITPAKGEFQGVPLNQAGQKIADAFDPAQYGGATATAPPATSPAGLRQTPPTPIGRYQVSGIIDCRAYGAPALMHMPTRLRISWDDANTLKIESDWGQQTRLLHFIPNRPYANAALPLLVQVMEPGQKPAAPSLQGHSVAVWEQPYDQNASFWQRGQVRGPGGGGGLNGAEQRGRTAGGYLAVVTGDLSPGWLRRNGVPYSERTRVIEHYQTFQDPTGAKWFDVATEVIDPQYLNAPFFTTGDFVQEPDGSKWAPHPCKQVAAD